MEIAPKTIDDTTLNHLVKDVIRVASLLLGAHVIPPENFIGMHVAHAIKVINDPFVEVVAPVGKGVCEHSSSLACSITRLVMSKLLFDVEDTNLPR
jgi:hypothetical protein